MQVVEERKDQCMLFLLCDVAQYPFFNPLISYTKLKQIRKNEIQRLKTKIFLTIECQS